MVAGQHKNPDARCPQLIPVFRCHTAWQVGVFTVSAYELENNQRQVQELSGIPVKVILDISGIPIDVQLGSQ